MELLCRSSTLENVVVTFHLDSSISSSLAEQNANLLADFIHRAAQCVVEELRPSVEEFDTSITSLLPSYASNKLKVKIEVPRSQLVSVCSLLDAARAKIERNVRDVMLCFVGLPDPSDADSDTSMSVRTSCDPLPVNARSETFMGLFESSEKKFLLSAEEAVIEYGDLPALPERSKRKRHLLKLYLDCSELSTRIDLSLRTDSADDMNRFASFCLELYDVFQPRQSVNFKYTWRQHQRKALPLHLDELRSRKSISDDYWHTNVSSFSLTDSSGDRHDLIAEPAMLFNVLHEHFPVVVEFDVGDSVVKPFSGTVFGSLHTEWLGCIEDYAIGKEFVWADFVSMTTLEDHILGTDGGKSSKLSFEIKCCSGITDVIARHVPARVSHLSQFRHETEILFPPNVRFRVHNIRNLDRSIAPLNKEMPMRIQFETVESPSVWDILNDRDWHLFEKWADVHSDWIATAGSKTSLINTVADAIVDLLKKGSDDIDIDDSKHALEVCMSKGADIHEKEFESGDTVLGKILRALNSQPCNTALQRIRDFVQAQNHDILEVLAADCDQDFDLEDTICNDLCQPSQQTLLSDSVSEVPTSASRSHLPVSPWLSPPVHGATKSLLKMKSSPRNPMRIPEPLGLVEPSWLPYTLPPQITASNGVAPTLPRQARKNLRRNRRGRAFWNSRHIVCGSKDNGRLPRLRRTYFDDMPYSRCQHGEYQAVPSHGARNFDHFSAAQGRDQVRELRRRFQQYPFIEALKESSVNSLPQQQCGDQLSAFVVQPRSPSTSSSSASIESGGENEQQEAPAAIESANITPMEGLRRFSLGRRSSETSSLRRCSISSDEFWTSPKQLKSKKSYGKTKMGNYSIFKKGILPQFHSWCGAKFGSLVQLWRYLDVHNHMRIGQGQFLRGLQDLGHTGDARELFKELNRDQTGTLLFYHFAPEAALAIGEVLHWARTQFGSLGEVGISRLLDKRAHITRTQFVQFCKKKGFENEVALDTAFDLMDKDRTDLVTKVEINFLDHWDFPEWLTAQPDDGAAEACKEKLVAHCHDNALLAWRHLDRHATMRVSWQDFRQVCRKMLYHEDCHSLASAWRSLDDDLSGWLSLREFDRATYDQLVKFVKWAEDSCGGILGVFPKLQGNKDAQISAYDFRHVCRPSGLGDAVIGKIFMGLDIDGTGSISMQEIRFLASWKVSADLLEEEAWGSLTRAACAPQTPKRKAAPRRPVTADTSALSGS